MKFKKFNALLLVITFLLCTITVNAAIGSMYGDTSQIKITLQYQDPDPVNAGKVVKVKLKIENWGGETTGNLLLEVLPEYPFSLYEGSAIREIGFLRATETGADAVITDYKLKVDQGAVDGENEIKLRYKIGKIGDNKPWILIEGLFIDIEKKYVNFQLGSLQTEPTRLVTDTEDAKLSIELQNIGEGKAENVMVELILPEGFKPSYSYSDIDNLGTIEGESSKTADFYIDVDENLQEGVYNATLITRYKEENDEDNEYKTEHIKVNIPLKATPLFEIVETKTVPETIRPGDKVELRTTIKNIGTKKAESVSIKAFKEASQPFEFDEKSDFIGLLEPGQSGEAVLSFIVEDDATAKTYLLDLEIRTINKEDVLVFAKTVPVRVSNNEKGLIGRHNIVGIMITILIVAGGLSVYMVWQRRKKRYTVRR